MPNHCGRLREWQRVTGEVRWASVRHDEKQSATSRTGLAEDRTILANERTYAGWVRTSIGCIALGVGFHALFNKMEPPWVPRAIATAFLLLAALIAWLAERRAAAVAGRLSTHLVERAKRVNLRLISACISLGAAALASAIWLLPMR